MTPYVRTARLVSLAGAQFKMEIVEGHASALALTLEQHDGHGPPVYGPAVVVDGHAAPLALCTSDADLPAWWCAEARAWLARHDLPVPEGGADVLAMALARAKGAA
jgi:hypothetical protein